MAAKISKEIVNERIASRGLKLIGEYVNVSTKASFLCSHGHEWSAIVDNVVRRAGCPHCAGRAKLTTAAVNKRIAYRGYVMTSEYVGVEKLSDFRCSQGHAWKATPGNVIHQTGCPHCAKTLGRDCDAVYMWRAKGQFFNGLPVYKFGVTSARLGEKRIGLVAKAAGFECDEILCTPVSTYAIDLERKLLALGQDPKYYGFDGCTEFRALNPSALDAALTIICENEFKA